MLMFAIRETTQESIGFAPADLVFGHTVRGPLRTCYVNSYLMSLFPRYLF